GCRQVFGLTGTDAVASTFPAASRSAAPVLVAGSFPITAAGQCRSGRALARLASPASLFIPTQGAGNRRAQDRGVGRQGQPKILWSVEPSRHGPRRGVPPGQGAPGTPARPARRAPCL